jgi:hypothetical protein
MIALGECFDSACGATSEARLHEYAAIHGGGTKGRPHPKALVERDELVSALRVASSKGQPASTC